MVPRWGASCPSLLLADQVLRSRATQVLLEKGESFELNPSVAFFPATVVTLFISPLSEYWMRYIIPHACRFVQMTIERFLWGGYPLSETGHGTFQGL